MMDPDYDVFRAVVSAGSLSAAGRALGISPAMMSKRITRLEQRLGARLLHRSTRRMNLTAQGERLYADLAGVAAALSEAEDRVRGNTTVPAGPLRITAPTSFGRMHIAPHVGSFLEAHPRIALKIDLSDDYSDLMQAPFDLAIRIADSAESGLAAHPPVDQPPCPVRGAVFYIAATDVPKASMRLKLTASSPPRDNCPGASSAPRGRLRSKARATSTQF